MYFWDDDTIYGPRPSRPVAYRPRSPSLQSLNVDVVTIYVGSPAKKFKLHKIALDAMPTLSEELQSRQAEEDDCLAFELPDCCTPQLFKMAIKWIYDHVLTEPVSTDNFWHIDVPLYKLARHFRIWDLHNLIMDDCFNAKSSIDLLKKLYDDGLRGSELYNYHLVGVAVNLMNETEDEINWDQIKEELSGEILCELISSKRDYNGDPTAEVAWEERCTFHVHPDGPRC